MWVKKEVIFLMGCISVNICTSWYKICGKMHALVKLIFSFEVYKEHELSVFRTTKKNTSGGYQRLLFAERVCPSNEDRHFYPWLSL